MNTRWIVLLAVLALPSLASAYTVPASVQAEVFGPEIAAAVVANESGAQPQLAADLLKMSADPLAANGPLDDGGGVSGDTRRILALILGFFPGFGIGHLIARNTNGFVLFLVIDLAIAVVGGTLGWAFNAPGFIWGLGGLLVVVERVIEGLDAYASAGGERFIERAREHSISFASISPVSDVPVTTRTFQLQF